MAEPSKVERAFGILSQDGPLSVGSAQEDLTFDQGY